MSRSPDVISQSFLMLELSLLVGRNAQLDANEQCRQFLRAFLSRKNLSYGSVWVRSQHLEKEPVECKYLQFCSVPFSHGAKDRLSTHFLALTALQEKRFVILEHEGESRTGREEGDFQNGRSVVIKLKNVGFLRLYSSKSTSFSEKEIVQLLPVIDILAVALDNHFAHVTLTRREMEALDQKQEADHLRLLAERALIDARDANAAKSRFLMSMSHELRTPLNSILGFSEAVEQEIAGPINDTQRDYISQVMTAGRHLLGLVNGILDLSQVESGSMIVNEEQESLASILQEAILMIRPLVRQRNLTVEFDPEAQDFDAVRVDRKILLQILVNLLSNAAKYNHDAGSISIEISMDDKDYAIAVSDTGPGIASKDIEKLFEPFERLGVEGSNIQGTGVGLTITRNLTDLLGGAINVVSRVGHGSTFTVRLPIAGSEAKKERGEDTALAAQ